MIVKINNSFDLLINLNNNIINKQFNDFEQYKMFC